MISSYLSAQEAEVFVSKQFQVKRFLNYKQIWKQYLTTIQQEKN